MKHSKKQLQAILEGAILAASEPLSLTKLAGLFEKEERPEKDDLMAALLAIQDRYKNRGFALVEVASGWRFQVRKEYATWVNRLWEEKPQKYSRALLETLALIAYRQPITRGDIEVVRGVAVSSHITKTLMERDWIKVVGHRDVPGRPALYATTRTFLDYFNLKSLDELPSLGELKDISAFDGDLDLDEPMPNRDIPASGGDQSGESEVDLTENLLQQRAKVVAIDAYSDRLEKDSTSAAGETDDSDGERSGYQEQPRHGEHTQSSTRREVLRTETELANGEEDDI